MPVCCTCRREMGVKHYTDKIAEYTFTNDYAFLDVANITPTEGV